MNKSLESVIAHHEMLLQRSLDYMKIIKDLKIGGLYQFKVKKQNLFKKHAREYYSKGVGTLIKIHKNKVLLTVVAHTVEAITDKDKPLTGWPYNRTFRKQDYPIMIQNLVKGVLEPFDKESLPLILGYSYINKELLHNLIDSK